MFCKRSVLKHFAKFTGKHLCQSLIFNKIRPEVFTNFIKKEALGQMFSCKFCENFNNIFSYRTPTGASVAILQDSCNGIPLFMWTYDFFKNSFQPLYSNYLQFSLRRSYQVYKHYVFPHPVAASFYLVVTTTYSFKASKDMAPSKQL